VSFDVASREYDISRIDGLPPSQVSTFSDAQLKRIRSSSARKKKGLIYLSGQRLQEDNKFWRTAYLKWRVQASALRRRFGGSDWHTDLRAGGWYREPCG